MQNASAIRVAVWLAAMGLASGCCTVHAAAGDLWANAPLIAALPFTDSDATATATEEPNDPILSCFVGAHSSRGRATVWYRYTTGAATEYVNVSTAGSAYDSIVGVFTGTPGDFRLIAGGCNDDGVGTTQSRLAGLRLQPNTSYSIEVASHGTLSVGGALSFSLTASPIYVVTRQDDPNPAVSGCAPGNCTLRSAIGANNVTPGAVIVPAGTYAIALGSSGEDANAGGDFDIKSSISIYGAGSGNTLIDANHKDRVFDVDSDSFSSPSTGRVTALFSDLAITNGGGPSFFGDGGAIRMFASGSSPPVANDFLVLDRVKVTASRSQLNGGAVALIGRGQIRMSEFSENYANSTGGALTLGPSLAGGDTTIEVIGSTIANNLSPSGFSGGGGIKSTARLRITNSTIVGNSTGYHGGGIYATGNGSLDIRSSTVANNIAASGGNTSTGGGIRSDGGVLNVHNSILSANTRGSGIGAADDCTANGGTLTGTFSLLTAASGCAFAGAGNIIGLPASFDGPLADHGGPTRTLTLAAGGAAIDAGDTAGCADSYGVPLATDQRGLGFPRVTGSRCDIGSTESPEAPLAVPGTPDLAAVSDTGASNADNLTYATALQFSGSCGGTDLVTLVVDGVDVSPTAACTSATYSITPSATLGEGAHSIAAKAARASQTTANSPALMVVIDRTPPIVVITGGPPITVISASATFTFGSGDASTTVCQLDANWFVSCTSPQSYTGLTVGMHDFAVRGTDAAGNASTDVRNWSITAPAAPGVPTLPANDDTGISNADQITSAATVHLNGACDDGTQIQLREGVNSVGVAQACAGGTYSITLSLGEGLHAISARAALDGVDSAPSATLSVTIDRTAPAPPTFDSPMSMSVVAPSFSVSGHAEAGSSLALVEGAENLCILSVDVSGSWQCVVTRDAGPHTLQAFSTDVAGNASDLGQLTVEIDQLFAHGFEF